MAIGFPGLKGGMPVERGGATSHDFGEGLGVGRGDDGLDEVLAEAMS